MSNERQAKPRSQHRDGKTAACRKFSHGCKTFPLSQWPAYFSSLSLILTWPYPPYPQASHACFFLFFSVYIYMCAMNESRSKFLLRENFGAVNLLMYNLIFIWYKVQRTRLFREIIKKPRIIRRIQEKKSYAKIIYAILRAIIYVILFRFPRVNEQVKWYCNKSLNNNIL